MEAGAMGGSSFLSFSSGPSAETSPSSLSPPTSSSPSPSPQLVSDSVESLHAKRPLAQSSRSSSRTAASTCFCWQGEGQENEAAPTISQEERRGGSMTAASAGHLETAREEAARCLGCSYTGEERRGASSATSVLSLGGERGRPPSRSSSLWTFSGLLSPLAFRSRRCCPQFSSSSSPLSPLPHPRGAPASACGSAVITDRAGRPASPLSFSRLASPVSDPSGVCPPRVVAARVWRLLSSVLFSLVNCARLFPRRLSRRPDPLRKPRAQVWSASSRSLQALLLATVALFAACSSLHGSSLLGAQAASPTPPFLSLSSSPRSLASDSAKKGSNAPEQSREQRGEREGERQRPDKGEENGETEETFPAASGVVPAPGLKVADLPRTGPPVDLLGLPIRKKVFRARLYGSMFSYAYYFLDILVGTPPQRASVILDTGSSLLAFPCAGCSECGQHLDPAMDTSRSATGEWIDCKEQERCFGSCSGGTPLGGLGGGGVSSMRRCMYTQTYSEGSAIRGIYFSDVVALGEVEQKNPPVRYDFVGCHTQETNLFVTQKAAGIFGISFPKGHRQPTLLDVMFGHTNLVDKKMFSVCISEDGGLLTVGGYEPTLLVAPPESESTPATEALRPVAGESASRRISEKTSPHHAALVTWTSIISHSTYRVPLSGMEVEGLVLGSGVDDFGNTMVDSGTTYSYFPPAVFSRWRSFLSRFCTPELFCERERDGRPCWRVSPGTDLSSIFPPIKVSFGDEKNSQVWWWPEGYLYRRTGGYFCDGLDDNRVSASVLGLSFFKNKQVLFDREQDRVGFAAAKCPSFFLDQRPRGPDSGDGPKGRPTAPFTVPPLRVPVPMDGGGVPGDAKQPEGLPLSPQQLWVAAALVVVAILIAVTVILLHTIKRPSRSSAVVPAPSAPRLPFAQNSKSAGRFARGLGHGALGVGNPVYVQRTQRYREVQEAQPHTADAYYDVEEDRFTGEDDGDFFGDDSVPSAEEQETAPSLSLREESSPFSASQSTLLDLPLGGE
ncbi:aspartyl protease ASP5 [Toxoplasma gondii RUB]|uniref:Aspartyl protease ASP5 n=1 Tax=Toxoplasma gondii RUB TaxID=935652 RepID=A0A086LU45_TOXGO|nr:aspartyl protease ASP5 [Toxoplasma gondii RUB]